MTMTLSEPIHNGVGEAIKAVTLGMKHESVLPEVAAALSSGSNGRGGFLIPSQLSSELIDYARNRSGLVRAGMRVVPMATSELQLARVKTPPTIQVKAENAPLDETDLAFDSVMMKAFTFGCYVTASRELAEDAPNFSSAVEQQIALALAQQIDQFGIQGTGSGQPVGLTIHPDISETSSVGAITWDDFAAAATVVRAANHDPSGILLSTTIYDDVRLTKDSQNRWLGPPPILDGVTWADTNNCPNAYAIVGDFSKMVMGMRTEVMFEATTTGGDTHRNHSIAYKVIMRGDFAILQPAAFHRLAGITT